jgi:hypothetical protein
MPDEKGGQQPSGNPDGNPPPPPPLQPTIEQRVMALEAYANTNPKETTAQHLFETVKDGELILIGTNALLVVINVIIAIFYYGQLTQMKTVTGLTRDAVNLSADSFMASNLNNANQTILNRAAQEASEKSANDSLQASIDTLHYEQRAWVFPAEYVLSREPDMSDLNVTITVRVVNKGKTPALGVYILLKPYQWHEIPPEVDWKTFKGNTKNIAAVLTPDTIPVSADSGTLTFVPAAVTDYDEGKRAIYIRAKIFYQDIFNQNHWFTICAFHTYGTPLNVFTWCGNDIDKDRKYSAKNP